MRLMARTVHRRIAIGLVPMLALVLAACGGGSTTANQHVTITFLTHYNQPPLSTIAQSVASKFEKAHPGVTVKIEALESGTEDAKFQTLASAGDPPNVFDMDNVFGADLLSKGVLSPVDYSAAGYSSQSALQKAYVNGALTAYSSGGKLYGIPAEYSNYLAWDNVKEFTAAGLSVPKTWQQVCADGPKMTQTANGKITHEELALPTNLAGAQYISLDAITTEFGRPLINAAGTKSYLTSSAVIKAMTMLQNLVYSCHAAYPALNSSEQGADRLVYESGQAAMLLTGGSWFTGGLDSSFPALKPPVSQPEPYPTQPGVPAANISYGYAYVVPKAAPNQQLDWAFAAALGNDGAAWFNGGGLYTGQSVVNKSSAAKSFPYWSSTWEPALSHATYMGNLVNGNQIDDIIGAAFDNIIEDHANVSSAMQSANSQVQPLLNQKPI
jgi:multiple sugar transport system substrate-binding protein